MKGPVVKLFKNRAFHVQVVDPLPVPEAVPTQPKPPIDFARLAVATKHVMQQAAVTGGALYGAKKAVDVLGEIAILAAKTKFK
jgi:hypothetical protein